MFYSTPFAFATAVDDSITTLGFPIQKLSKYAVIVADTVHIFLIIMLNDDL